MHEASAVFHVYSNGRERLPAKNLGIAMHSLGYVVTQKDLAVHTEDARPLSLNQFLNIIDSFVQPTPGAILRGFEDFFAGYPLRSIAAGTYMDAAQVRDAFSKTCEKVPADIVEKFFRQTMLTDNGGLFIKKLVETTMSDVDGLTPSSVETTEVL
jgi:Ca2+-binding EF-hand superfamily protein